MWGLSLKWVVCPGWGVSHTSTVVGFGTTLGTTWRSFEPVSERVWWAVRIFMRQCVRGENIFRKWSVRRSNFWWKVFRKIFCKKSDSKQFREIFKITTPRKALYINQTGRIIIIIECAAFHFFWRFCRFSVFVFSGHFRVTFLSFFFTFPKTVLNPYIHESKRCFRRKS